MGTTRLAVTPAHAQSAGVVRQIVVYGNQRVEAETVRSYMQISVGEDYDASKVAASTKALFRTGLFADVRISRKGGALIITVVENPLINRVNFEGNHSLDDKALDKEVQMRARMVFTKARAQADVQRIVALYRRSGRFAVRAEPKIIQLSQNRVNLVYEITEGPVTRVERINFIGNRAFSDSQLRGVVATSESRWWKILSKADNYDPDRLAFDKELLRRHYLKNGFADFQVLTAVAELARDGNSFFISITVKEGPQYRFGTSKVESAVALLDGAKLERVIETTPGHIYDTTKVDKTVEQIALEAGKTGFAFAKVRPKIERDEANRTINLTYVVQEGPRVYIERIDIIGNLRTLDRVIRRQFRLDEGDAYNKILIDKARRRLVALDFFEKVEIEETPGSAGDKVVLKIKVVEKSTGQLSLGAGVSSSEILVGDVSISERNFLGRGQFVRLRTALSFKRQQLDFSFTEPFFLERRISAGIDLFAIQTNVQTESSFDSERVGAGFRFGFPVSENASLITRYTLRYDRIKNVDPGASVAIFQAQGSEVTSSVGYTLGYNTLDNPLDPSKGWQISLSQDFAGLGGTLYYVKSEFKAAYYHPIWWEGVVGSLRFSAGAIEGFNGDEVRILDRFFKGDASFRGFERAGVGPRDIGSPNNDSVGGKYYSIGTAELLFPLGLPEEFGLKGAVFSDFGSVFGAPSVGGTSNIQDDASLRASAGAGILWKSPFGLVRVDLAYAFLKESYDKDEFFRFGVGTQF